MPDPAHEPGNEPHDAGASKESASEALDMMVEALKLLDLGGGAGVAGAHLDLAIHRLREWIEQAAPK